MDNQKFGGHWTVEKLNIFSNYLDFYLKVLKNQKYKKIYIDAFAGTGQIEMRDDDVTIEGSARLALNATNKFSRYIFIEKDNKKANGLKSVIENEYHEYLPITEVINGDSNLIIKEFCEKTNWIYNRALMFLDPFATQVKWETLECISKTKAIDLWYLFPVSAVQRLLPNNGVIPETWKNRLNSIFGNNEWEAKFYEESSQMCFDGWNDNNEKVKIINTDSLSQYICERLGTIFAAVAPNPRILYNSNRSPLFLFYFAVSNESAKSLALRGASYILNKKVN